ncbi:MAG: phage tail tape measure protein [Leptotrichia wadei]|uniref:Phage tail tape measure protein, TP901 family n=1 Tax=Leptotrichia wadei (strain F0279) TaxID=888055 RepID=U2PX89_LEPWF|nr:phage tail tape measure protein [Leptotrichia wadei]ERK48364.1 phage tail tape measure protein, TP901 family [Leptotrichia wadei F0279]DAK31811.1 MAG TPA: minor tail protein [Caudoviricetes sp.]
MSEYKLSALLELKDKFTNVAQKAGSSLGTLKDKVGGIAGKIKNSFSGVQGALATVGVGIGAGTAVSVLKSSVEAYANLEDQVRRNKAIMGATVQQEKQLMQQTRDLGRSTKFTAQEVAEAQMYQAMAGMKTNEVLEMTPKLLKMSIAAGSDFAQTSDIVTDNLTAFGMSLKDSDRLMDVMVATSNNANTNVQMLGEAYKYVAATSRNFESFEDVNILLGVLADNGIKSGQAGRNLAGIYRRLANPSKQVGNALKDLNIQLYDQQGHFRGLKALSDDLKIATAGLTQEERNRYLTMIAGGEGMKILASIMGTTEENYNKVANAVRNSSGATDKFADDMSNTTANKIAQFKSAIDDLKISLGEAFAPIATRWMEDFMKRVEEWQKSGALDPEKLKGQAEQLTKGAEIGMRGIIGAKGAIWGAQLGTAIGGPVGTAVGAAIGGAIGYYTPDIVKKLIEPKNPKLEKAKQQAVTNAFDPSKYASRYNSKDGQFHYMGYSDVKVPSLAEAQKEEASRIARQKEYDRRSYEALQKVVLDINALKTRVAPQQNLALTQQDKTAQLTSAISQLVSKQQNNNPLQPFDPSAITNAISSGLSPLNSLPSLLNTSLSTMQPPIPQPVSIEQVINHQANAQIAAQLSNITINDTAKIESIARQIAQNVSQNTYNTMMSNLQAQIQASQ